MSHFDKSNEGEAHDIYLENYWRMYIFFILVPPMFGDILAPSISLHTKREKPLMFRTFCSPLNFEKLYRTMSWSQVWLSIPFSKRNLDFSLIKIARKSRIRDVNSGI